VGPNSPQGRGKNRVIQGRQRKSKRRSGVSVPVGGPELDPKIEIPEHLLSKYSGKYEIAPGATFEVIVNDGELLVQFSGLPQQKVYAMSEVEFYSTASDTQFTFMTDTEGTVDSLILHRNGEDNLLFPKISG